MSRQTIAQTIEHKKQIHHDRQKSQENSFEITLGADIIILSLIPVVPINNIKKHEYNASMMVVLIISIIYIPPYILLFLLFLILQTDALDIVYLFPLMSTP